MYLVLCHSNSKTYIIIVKVKNPIFWKALTEKISLGFRELHPKCTSVSIYVLLYIFLLPFLSSLHQPTDNWPPTKLTRRRGGSLLVARQAILNNIIET